MEVPLDWKVIATTVLVAGGGFVSRYVIGLIKAHNRVRASVYRLERGMLAQHKRVRYAYDAIRKLAYIVESIGQPGAAGHNRLELHRIRAKVDQVRDTLWAEEGNPPRRRHDPDETEEP